MAEQALRIKVNKDVYMKTLEELDNEIAQLRSKRDRLQQDVERLKSGGIFSGTAVIPAIKKGEEALEKVKDLLSRVMGYRVAIENELMGLESTTQQLESDMNDIDLPNLFK